MKPQNKARPLGEADGGDQMGVVVADVVGGEVATGPRVAEVRRSPLSSFSLKYKIARSIFRGILRIH